MNGPNFDESALIERAKSDSEAFGELYERHFDRIYNYIYYRTGNIHDAEDLTARVFFRAIQHIGNYIDQGGPFSAWLYSIARNLLANWYRDNSRRTMIPIDAMAQLRSADGPELESEIVENRATLLAAIRRLPDDRQDLLILKYVNKQSNAEIGRILGRSEGAIKSLYHRTLLSLKSDLMETSRRDQISRQEQAKGKSGWSIFRSRISGNRLSDR
ncbi:MAG: sigma-70 family RNA polymerase sigma factor [Candidatus Promineifilaceae bacterium]